jgi:hypothetical protein
VQPAREHRPPRERRGFAREVRENVLRNFFREMRVAADLPERRAVNKLEMATHQFREGLVRAILGIATEQFGVLDHGLASFTHLQPKDGKPNKESDRELRGRESRLVASNAASSSDPFDFRLSEDSLAAAHDAPI